MVPSRNLILRFYTNSLIISVKDSDVLDCSTVIMEYLLNIAHYFDRNGTTYIVKS
jgi:hypothetical protein